MAGFWNSTSSLALLRGRGLDGRGGRGGGRSKGMRAGYAGGGGCGGIIRIHVSKSGLALGRRVGRAGEAVDNGRLHLLLPQPRALLVGVDESGQRKESF